MRAVVEVPGSKSITNRALVLAALADGPSVVRNGLRARDTSLMIAALRSLGVGIEDAGGTWTVTPGPLSGPAVIDCGLAGTIMRFLPPVACLADGEVRIDGDPRARQRPMAPLFDTLRSLGADVESTSGRLPALIRGHGGLPGGEAEIDASASSQFVSGLLLSAARFDRGLDLQTGRVPSGPHLEMTLAMLAEHGVRASAEGIGSPRARFQVEPGPLRALDRVVEPDLSNALPFLAAAMATAGSITITGWPTGSTQPGARLGSLLRAMGARVRMGADGLTVEGPDRLAGLHADLGEVGELTPVLAALAALAPATSRLTGIAHLRGHETDRLAALAAELNGLGGKVIELPDGLQIEGAPLHGGSFRTYDDHRIATAGAVLGLVVPGIDVIDVGTTAKTMPDFVDRWTAMLAGS